MVKVSVVLPAYNSMEYLPQTLANILCQTFEDFEVIIVNDGSSDNIKEWFSGNIQDSRVKLISQPNQGVAVALNTGIEQAQGDYIAFSDQDDLWEPTKLEKQVKALDENSQVGLVYTWVAYIDSQGNLTGRVRKHNVDGMVLPTLIQYNLIDCGSVAMVRRECFERLGGFDKSVDPIIDWDMWLRIASHYCFKVISEPLVYYRQHMGSASRKWEIMEASYHKILSRFYDSAPPELVHLQGRSYALAYLCLAWKPLQSRQKDYQQSAKLLAKAVSYDSKIRLTKDYWRLSFAITALQYLGADGYEQFTALVHGIRRRIIFGDAQSYPKL